MVLAEDACLDGGRAPACLLGLREPSKASKASPKVAKRAGHLHMLGSQRTLLNAQRAIVELDCLTASFPRRCSAHEQVASRKSEPSASRASSTPVSAWTQALFLTRRSASHGNKAAPRHRNVSAAAARLLTRLLHVAEVRHSLCHLVMRPRAISCRADFCEQISASRFLSAEDETVFHLHV